MFTEAHGKPNTVCFKNMNGFIVYGKCLPREKKTQMTERIIVTAAMLTNRHVTL